MATIRSILSHEPTTNANNRSLQFISNLATNNTAIRLPIRPNNRGSTLSVSCLNPRSSRDHNQNGSSSTTTTTKSANIVVKQQQQQQRRDNNTESTCDGELLCTIKIPPGDWQRISHHYSVVNSNGRVRRKYLTIFHDYLSMRAQREGLMCWLANKFNWVNQTSPAWRGQYYCIDPNCTAKYTAVIMSVNPEGMTEMKLYKLGHDTHVKPIQKSYRLSRRVFIRRKAAPNENNNTNNKLEDDQQEVVNNYEDAKIELPIGENDFGNEEITAEDDIDPLDLFIDHDQNYDQVEKDHKNNHDNQNHNSSNNDVNGLNHHNTEDDEDFFYPENEVHSESSNPSEWTSEEVYDFVTALAGSDIAGQFKWHDIDGQALDYLRVENLVNVMLIKMGPAARIKSNFDQIKRAYLDSTRNTNTNTDSKRSMI